ncbi:ATP-binding protein [Pleionea sediminis]|uniref:ATP-binding protein n=1 Tax=Pleionea sediminis TaxID=2569479 RepID=UPI0011851443|nr:ATP-binding protein [Pleionea sediminis]
MAEGLLENIQKKVSKHFKADAISMWLVNEHGFKKKTSSGNISLKEKELQFVRDVYIASKPVVSGRYVGVLLSANSNTSVIFVFETSTQLKEKNIENLQLILSEFSNVVETIPYYEITDDISSSTSRALAVANILDAIRQSERVLEDKSLAKAIAQTIEQIAQTKNIIVARFFVKTNKVDTLYYEDEHDEPRFPFDLDKALVNGSVTAFIIKFAKTLRGSSIEICRDLGVETGEEYGTHANDLIGMPIRNNDRVFGALIVQTYDSSQVFKDYVPSIISIIADALANRAIQQELNDELNATIERRTAELREKNEALNHAIEELKKTKQELVRSESQAYLARTICKIAHNLNTPIGNAKVSTSITADLITDISNKLKTMNDNEIAEDVEDILSSCRLTDSALSKASSVISELKKLGTTESEFKISKFSTNELFTMIKEVSLSMLNGKQVEFKLEGDDQLIESYYTVLGEILLSLVENSLEHGYLMNDNFYIQLKSKVTKDNLELQYFDNGKGLDVSMKNKLFDAFETNAEIAGRLGLGMSIVQYLISNILKGTIKINEEHDVGLGFTISIPLTSS